VKDQKRYSSTLSLTSALDGSGWSTLGPGRFTPRKETRYPWYRRLDGPQCRSERLRKISPAAKFDPSTVQPVASRYTDWTIPAHRWWCCYLKVFFPERFKFTMCAYNKRRARMSLKGCYVHTGVHHWKFLTMTFQLVMFAKTPVLSCYIPVTEKPCCNYGVQFYILRGCKRH
jgi:hypothetical protein